MLLITYSCTFHARACRFAAPPFLDAITSDPVVQAQLLNFLGNDLNEMLQRISDPRPAPAPDNPCKFLRINSA